jgi:hypothetical protein
MIECYYLTAQKWIVKAAYAFSDRIRVTFNPRGGLAVGPDFAEQIVCLVGCEDSARVVRANEQCTNGSAARVDWIGGMHEGPIQSDYASVLRPENARGRTGGPGDIRVKSFDLSRFQRFDF